MSSVFEFFFGSTIAQIISCYVFFSIFILSVSFFGDDSFKKKNLNPNFLDFSILCLIVDIFFISHLDMNLVKSSFFSLKFSIFHLLIVPPIVLSVLIFLRSTTNSRLRKRGLRISLVPTEEVEAEEKLHAYLRHVEGGKRKKFKT